MDTSIDISLRRIAAFLAEETERFDDENALKTIGDISIEIYLHGMQFDEEMGQNTPFFEISEWASLKREKNDMAIGQYKDIKETYPEYFIKPKKEKPVEWKSV